MVGTKQKEMNLTGLTKQEALEILKEEKVWKSSDIRNMVQGLVSPMLPVETVIVGDVLAKNGLGHSSIVIHTTDDNVLSVILTTSQQTPSLIRKCNSRIWVNNHFTYTTCLTRREIALTKVRGIYDNIPELYEIKRLIKQFYRSL